MTAKPVLDMGFPSMEDRFERAMAGMETGQIFLDLGCEDGQLTALANEEILQS